jgi:diaminopropionate ammonia-lyase
MFPMDQGHRTGLWYCRPEARGWRCAPFAPGAYAFHQGLPGYTPTLLLELPALADELGVGRVFVKDESSRFGLPAFKILGVSWAVYRALSQRAGGAIEPASIDRMREMAPALGPLVLVTATDGNHGRALAHFAAMLGLSSHVFVPDHLRPPAIAAIEAEGATVTRIAGSYDEAVRQAASLAAGHEGAMFIQDTAWPGYEEIPAWTVEGYSTLSIEADAQLEAFGISSPDLVAVPTGVGSLLQSTLRYYRRDSLAVAPIVLSVEPDSAACVLASVLAGELTSVKTGQTIMSGLNCESTSSLAWTFIEHGLDASVAVFDDEAMRAMDDLTRLGIAAGPSGAASLAGVRTVLADPGRRASLGLSPDATLLLICTEGRASGAA